MSDLRSANRREVLNLLRINGALIQAEISRATGLSHASVSNIVRDLTTQGLVGSSPVTRNGRRLTEVTLNPSSGLVGGIDFGNRHVRAAVADFTHTVRAEASHTLPYGHEASQSIADAAEMFRTLVAGTGQELTDVRRLAVGLPGPMDAGHGRTTSAAILPGWADVDVRSAFEQRLNIDTVVDNDANLGALAEGFWGAGRGFTDFAYVKVSTGIGAGLVLNGRLYRGIAGTAGEIGHTTIEEDGPLCRCGNRGCLEMFAAAPALLDLVRGSYGDHLTTIEDVLRLSDEGNVGCRRIITDAGRHIGVALANLCNLLSPQVIIVGGELALAGDVLLSAIRESMGRRAVSIAPTPEVITSVLSERVGVLGALALALQESEDDTNNYRPRLSTRPIGSDLQFPLAG